MRREIPSVAVYNSGTHPEPPYWAAAANHAGLRCAYLTSTSFKSSSALMRLARSSLMARTPIGATVLRRTLPVSMDGCEVVGVSRMRALSEQLRQAFGAEGDDLVDARMTAFRRSSARWTQRNGPNIIVAQYTSALGAFESQPGTRRVLLYPIAHHDWMADELEIEAQRNPSWREFLQGRYSPPAKKSLLDREIELASSIVVPSNFAKQSFIERGVDPSRLHVISLGATSVDPALHDRPGGFRPSQKRGSALRVLFAGQVNQRKGISYLLEAVANLGKHVAELEIIGPSTERMRERLQAYRENVVLSSPVPRRQLMQAMGHADVLVLPSLAEGFGLVALEAMAMGTPAVVTERTFGTDVITSGIDGWVVESGSAQALVKVLQSLADDRTLLAAAGVAAKSTATRFTWDRYARSAGEFLMTP